MSLSVKPLSTAVVLVGLAASTWALTPVDSAKSSRAESIARGRYIARIGGCNDCHTQGYAESGGKVPETKWLLGNAVGYRGDWGTTYAANLRNYIHGLTEDQWVTAAHSAQLRPPMPWFTLRAMNEPDLRAFYRFVKYLGPAGTAAPAYEPPGKAPRGPAVEFPRVQAQLPAPAAMALRGP
jgi:hypothetical protein